MELVPLDGADEGDGNFFGNICSQYGLGTLAASEETEARVRSSVKKRMNLRLKESNMVIWWEVVNFGFEFRMFDDEVWKGGGGFWEGMEGDMVSNVRKMPTSFVVEKVWQWQTKGKLIILADHVPHVMAFIT